MSPLDVHVNRSPFAATIERMEHRSGHGRKRAFLPAMKKESEHNERVRTVLLGDDSIRAEVCQISGALPNNCSLDGLAISYEEVKGME